MRTRVCLAIALASVSMLSINSAARADVSCQIDGKVYRTAKLCIEQMQTLTAVAKPAPKKKKTASIPALTQPPPQSSNPVVQRILGEGNSQSSWMAYIRQSMDDLKSFEQPSTVSSAKGALFSWTDDRVQNNETWVAQGLAAVRYDAQFAPVKGQPYWSDALVGGYVAIDHQVNSNPANAKNNIDNLTFDGRAEFVMSNLWDASHSVGMDAQVVTDSEGVAKNWAVTADYTPHGFFPVVGQGTFLSWLDDPIDLGYSVLTFTPQLNGEYRGSINNNTDPLFIDHAEILRFGSTLLLTVGPNVLRKDDPTVPVFFQRSSLNLSYEYLYDTLSQRQFNYFTGAYTFNIDPNGNLGVTLSYRHGDIPATAQTVDQYLISLSAKLDANLVNPTGSN
jgi:hypothetical protein